MAPPATAHTLNSITNSSISSVLKGKEMDVGLWVSGTTVPVSRVSGRAIVHDSAAQTTLSFSYNVGSAATDTLFKAQLDPFLGNVSGFSVNVGGKETTSSFLSSEKATDLYGKDNIDSQHSFSEDDDKEVLICNIGEVEANTAIVINISVVTELSLSSGSLRFTIPAIHWLEAKHDLTYDLDIDVNVVTSTEATVSSPSHPNATITPSGKQTHVQLTTHEKNEDFLLSITHNSTYTSHTVERIAGDISDKYATMLFLCELPTNLRVDWGVLNAQQIPNTLPKSKLVTMYSLSSVFSIPHPFPSMYTSNTSQDAPTSTITVQADGIEPISFVPSETDVREGALIHQLAARARICELVGSEGNKEQIRDLGVRYGLTTAHTAAFAKNGRVSLISVRPLLPTLKTSSSSSSSDSDAVLSGESQPAPRKVYDSKFLLTFREHCTDLPEGLPPMEVILGKGNTGKIKPPQSGFRKGSEPRGGGRDRRKQQPPATPVEPLKQTEGRWQRPTTDVAASELLMRTVLGLLNKLTLEKFDALSAQFATLKIGSLEDLTDVCRLVFEKAISEQHFCSMYADLCKKLSESYPTFSVTEDGKTVTQTFKRLLLNMCQKEFECTPPTRETKSTTETTPTTEPTETTESKEPQEVKETTEIKEETEAKDAKESTGPTEAKETKELTPEEKEKLEADELERKYRRRTLGNIRFIGELFKLGLLREAIMHECVTRLLTPTQTPPTPTAVPTPSTDGTPSTTEAPQPKLPSEEDLEALCKLLRTMGKRLDRPGVDRQKMDRYFSIIASLSRNRELPSRHRFLLLDLIDLRKNEWIPRRVDNGPKTIAAVHADAEKADRLAKEETALRESGGHRFSAPHLRTSGGVERDGKDGRGDGRRDGRDGRGDGRDRENLRSSSEVEKDGWETVGKPAKGNADKWEVAGSKNKRGGFQEVKGGRRDSKPPANAGRGNTNSKDKDRNKDKGGRDNTRDNTRDNGRKQGGAKKDKEKAAPAPKGNVFSSLDIIDEDEDEGASSSGSTTPTSSRVAAVVNGHGSTLTPAQLEARTDAILDEYLATSDVAEAVESIREMQAPEYHSQIVVRAINLVLEKNKPNQLEQIDTLFAAAFTDSSDLVRGFEEILESIEDLDIDIPMASRHVATLIGSAIARGTLQFSFLFEALGHLVASGKAETMAVAALSKILKESGEAKLIEMYESTQRNLTELFKSGRTKDFIDTFLRSKDLAFLAERLS